MEDDDTVDMELYFGCRTHAMTNLILKAMKLKQPDCSVTCSQINELLRHLDRISNKRRASELKYLQKEVQMSRVHVQRHLSLGWIGVYDSPTRRGLLGDNRMSRLMDLWQKFRLFLSSLENFYVKLEKILGLWEKIPYLLLLYLSFSEFPNKLRPPCTTMPWTIWPALVVLWGVCWMFYEDFDWNWEEKGELVTASSVTQLLEDLGHTDTYQVINDDFGSVDYDYPLLNAPHFNMLNFEQQFQPFAPGPATTFDTTISLDPKSTLSAVNPTATIRLPIIDCTDGSEIVSTSSSRPYPTTRTTQRATEDRQLGATESKTLAPPSIPLQSQPRDGQVGPSQNSKHSKTEKYLCLHSDCDRSRPGSGFKRKDHLDQHLRGVHKDASVPRLRSKPRAASSIEESTASSDSAEALIQTKKRKRVGEQEAGASNVKELEAELAEEQRLRRVAEKDNRLLRRKLEKYELRMEKYEERLDRMMTLLEKHPGEKGG